MRWTWFALTFLSWVALNSGVWAEDRVFLRTDAAGRRVFTNVENIAVGEAALEALELHELQKLDLSPLPELERVRLDARIEEAFAAAQAGPQCRAIRSASRVPLRTMLWHSHRRELLTALSLFGFSLALGFGVPRRGPRSLLPVAPFLGALFVGYVAVSRSQDALTQLHGGLRACSAELPESEPASLPRIQSRLSSAVDLRSQIERVAAQRMFRTDAAIERDLR